MAAHPIDPVTNIEGKAVALGPLRHELIPLYARWRNDFTVARTLDFIPGPFTIEERETWWARVSTDTESIRFTIYERQNGRPIGIANLINVDHRKRTAGIGLMIGETDCWGKGYGTETTRLLLDYAFTVLGMQNVMLHVYEFNAAARRCYEKVGFLEIGRRRKSHWFNGQFWDEIAMDILDTEFESPVLRALLDPDSPRD
jgi:RimJ/RimL family protein N-acetyltransferase